MFICVVLGATDNLFCRFSIMMCWYLLCIQSMMHLIPPYRSIIVYQKHIREPQCCTGRHVPSLTMNTGPLVYFESIPHMPSCCCECSPVHQIYQSADENSPQQIYHLLLREQHLVKTTVKEITEPFVFKLNSIFVTIFSDSCCQQE